MAEHGKHGWMHSPGAWRETGCLPPALRVGRNKKKIALKSKRGDHAGSESDFPWHPGAARKPWHAEMCHSLITYNLREAMGHSRHGWQRRGGCGGLPWHGSKHAASAPAESPRGGNDPN